MFCDERNVKWNDWPKTKPRWCGWYFIGIQLSEKPTLETGFFDGEKWHFWNNESIKMWADLPMINAKQGDLDTMDVWHQWPEQKPRYRGSYMIEAKVRRYTQVMSAVWNGKYWMSPMGQIEPLAWTFRVTV